MLFKEQYLNEKEIDTMYEHIHVWQCKMHTVQIIFNIIEKQWIFIWVLCHENNETNKIVNNCIHCDMYRTIYSPHVGELCIVL